MNLKIESPNMNLNTEREVGRRSPKIIYGQQGSLSVKNKKFTIFLNYNFITGYPLIQATLTFQKTTLGYHLKEKK